MNITMHAGTWAQADVGTRTFAAGNNGTVVTGIVLAVIPLFNIAIIQWSR